MHSKKIPDRWTNYSNFGTYLTGTKFLPMKTPLKLALTKNRLPIEKWFTPQHVLEQLPRMKLLINLTLTPDGRYYHYEDFENEGVQIFQIKCQGRGSLPGKKQLEQFYNAVDTFDSDNTDGLIGVHCTHGLNRTGYFICKYLVDRKNMAPNAAIELFEEARGHQIERPQYLTNLRAMAKWSGSGGSNDYGFSSTAGSHTSGSSSRESNPKLSSMANWRVRGDAHNNSFKITRGIHTSGTSARESSSKLSSKNFEDYRTNNSATGRSSHDRRQRQARDAVCREYRESSGHRYNSQESRNTRTSYYPEASTPSSQRTKDFKNFKNFDYDQRRKNSRHRTGNRKDQRQGYSDGQGSSNWRERP